MIVERVPFSAFCLAAGHAIGCVVVLARNLFRKEVVMDQVIGRTEFDDVSKHKIVKLKFQQLDLPTDILQEPVLRLLQFIATDLFSNRFLHGAAKDCLIHVVRRPRTKKEIYLVVRGLLLYMILAKNGWADEIRCVLHCEEPNYNSMIFQDLAFSLCGIASDYNANAAKAAILRVKPIGGQILRNLELSEDFVGSGANTEKKLIGFSRGAYVRSKKNQPPAEIKEIIDNHLNIKKKKGQTRTEASVDPKGQGAASMSFSSEQPERNEKDELGKNSQLL